MEENVETGLEEFPPLPRRETDRGARRCSRSSFPKKQNCFPETPDPIPPFPKKTENNSKTGKKLPRGEFVHLHRREIVKKESVYRSETERAALSWSRERGRETHREREGEKRRRRRKERETLSKNFVISPRFCQNGFAERKLEKLMTREKTPPRKKSKKQGRNSRMRKRKIGSNLLMVEYESFWFWWWLARSVARSSWLKLSLLLISVGHYYSSSSSSQ